VGRPVRWRPLERRNFNFIQFQLAHGSAFFRPRFTLRNGIRLIREYAPKGKDRVESPRVTPQLVPLIFMKCYPPAKLMTDFDPDLTVKPAQRKDGKWYAEATRSYGPAEQIGSFKSEAEVQDWIINNSTEYFRQRGGSRP
jgi:hypothetical protein